MVTLYWEFFKKERCEPTQRENVSLTEQISSLLLFVFSHFFFCYEPWTELNRREHVNPDSWVQAMHTELFRNNKTMIFPNYKTKE